MSRYNLSEWVDGFERDGREFDIKTDVLLSNIKVLFPGRFYILNYKAQTDKPYNARPVIISLGLSKTEPDSFLCIDLCLIPKKIRIRFVQILFDMFERQVSENMEKFWNVEDADKPFKHAVKKYKIKNTFRIYSVPFSGVYKIVGKLCDKNCFVNSNVKIEQGTFLKNNNTNK